MKDLGRQERGASNTARRTGGATGIRPLEREDLPRAVRLFELVMRPQASPLPQLRSFLEQTLFDNPWADSELPSLVYEDEQGEIVGLICSNPRRMLFDGRPVRMTCSAYLLTHPGARNRAPGALLLRAHLAGSQDLTITDGGTDTVRRMWEGLGGQTAHLGCLSFVKVFRPWQLAGDQVLRGRSFKPLESGLRPVWSALDRASERVAKKALVPPRPDGTAEQLTAAAMLEHLPDVAGSVRLRSDYDQPYLEWLFDRVDDITRWGPVHPRLVPRGPLWAELVRKNGQVQGWFICHLRRGGACRLLQLAATDHGVDMVVDQLVYCARQRGAAGLYGRMEPRLVAPVSRHRCLLRFSPGRLLVHSRQKDITDAILSGDALLTRLDGEWW